MNEYAEMNSRELIERLRVVDAKSLSVFQVDRMKAVLIELKDGTVHLAVQPTISEALDRAFSHIMEASSWPNA